MGHGLFFWGSFMSRGSFWGCLGASGRTLLPGGVESRSVAFGSGSDSSEEPAVQDVEPVTLDSRSFLFCPPGPTWTSALLLGVGFEVAVDDVGDPSLERADCFFGGLSLGDFAVEVDAASGVVAELCDRNDVERPVQLPVAALVQPMANFGA